MEAIFDLLNKYTDGKIYEQEDTKQSQECDSCGGDLITEDGMVLCSICGSVTERSVIDQHADKVFYGQNDSRTTDPSTQGCVSSSLLPKSSMSTMIVGKGSKYFSRMHTWTSMPPKERSLWKVFEIIQNRCNLMELPQCIADKAKEYYHAVKQEQTNRGNIHTAIMSACVFVACKKHNVPRTAKEISELFKISNKLFTRGLKEFNMVMAKNLSEEESKATSNTDFLERYCNKMNLNNDVEELIRKVLQKADKNKLFNNNTPGSSLSGTIAFVCEIMEIEISREKLSSICDVSVNTINKVCQKLKDNQDNLLKVKVIDE